jgi:protein O-GlcNAc transferase
MNIRRFAALLSNEFHTWGTINAYPVEPKAYIDVLRTVQGMTTPSTMHLLNLAVYCMEPDECYMEVGTWRGATLIGALLGNDAYGVAIDNDTMNDHDGDDRSSRDVWDENVIAHGIGTRAAYVDGSVPSIFATQRFLDELPNGRIGVYLFDGDKSTEEAAYAGLVGVVPFLANEALIFIDDANEMTIRMAAHRFERAYPDNAVKIIDIPTPGNCWPCFWNGIMAIAWRA